MASLLAEYSHSYLHTMITSADLRLSVKQMTEMTEMWAGKFTLGFEVFSDFGVAAVHIRGLNWVGSQRWAENKL